MTANETHRRTLRAELWFLGALLLALNVGLFLGRVPEGLVLTPAAWTEFEWWRWLTHPWVHISPYHFVLDAGAFLGLYALLPAMRRGHRALLLLSCALGSTGAALAAGALHDTSGFCGLSGMAHGLMGVAAWSAATAADRPPAQRRLGVLFLLIIAAKSLYEAATGSLLWNGLHLGRVGAPILECHAGGLAGGLCACPLILSLQRLERPWNGH